MTGNRSNPLKGTNMEWLSRFRDRCRWVGCAVAGARELSQHRFFRSSCGIALQAWFDLVSGDATEINHVDIGANFGAWHWHVASKNDWERRSCKVLQEYLWPFEEKLAVHIEKSTKNWEDSGKTEMPVLSFQLLWRGQMISSSSVTPWWMRQTGPRTAEWRYTSRDVNCDFFLG